MIQNVEISTLNCRYESYRMQNKEAERILLSSIVEQGILEPLEGVDQDGGRVLLNGFKRLRCARKLSMEIVPYVSLANDPARGILSLLRVSNAKGLSILEQAALIDELKKTYQWSVSDIAQVLEKSKGWVSVRSGILTEMTEGVRQKLLNGEFPVYAYMYTLRQFMRINKISPSEIEGFINALAGKRISLRDIERLAQGYFRGSEDFRNQLTKGNVAWGLSRMKEPSATSPQCSPAERDLIQALDVLQKTMSRVLHKSQNNQLKSLSFKAQANLLTGGILRQMGPFRQSMEVLYAHTGEV